MEVWASARAENSNIIGKAKLTGHAYVRNSTISGNAMLCGHAVVRDSRVGGNALIGGTVLVTGEASIGNEAVLDADQVIGEGAFVEWPDDVYACGRAEGEIPPNVAEKIPERLTFYKNDSGGISLSYMDGEDAVSAPAEDFLSGREKDAVWDVVFVCYRAACLQITDREPDLGKNVSLHEDAGTGKDRYWDPADDYGDR